MADEVQLQPQTYEDAAGLINGFVDDYSAQAAIVSNYTLNNQKYLAANEFDNPEYTPTADTIQRDGNELAFTAIQGNARSILKDLGPESGNKVWGAYLDNADASGFSEPEIAGLKQVREMAAQFPIHPVNKQIFEMTLGGPTAPRKGRKRSLGAFQLTERPDGSMEAGILQSEAPVPNELKTLALDSDVDKKIAELEAERDAATEEAEALRSQAPAAGRFDGESAQSMASDNAIINALQRADDADARIKRYQSPQGKRMYAIDQMDKVLRTKPYIDYFGQEFSINAFGETLDKGGLRMGASLLTTARKGVNLSARAQFKGVAGIAGALGADEFAEQLDEASKDVFQKREQGIRESQQGMEDWIEVEFPGMEKTRLADTFMGNVAAGITEEAVPMAISIAVTGGTSWVGKKIGSYAAKKTVGELVKKGTLNYVDNVVAPFMGALTSSTRDGVDGWMEAQRAGDAVLQEAGFDSVEAAEEAGNQEVADKARRIFDDSNKVFLGNIATTTGTEMLMMRAYLGRMGNKAAAQQDELTSKLLKEQSDRFWKDMGAAAGDAVGEGVTENIQGVLSRGWAKRYYDSHQEMFPKDEMTQEFAIGMIMGGVTSSTLSRVNAAQAGRMIKKFEQQEGRRKDIKRFADKTDALFQAEAAQNEAVEKLRAERGGDVEVVATKVLNDRINTLANEMDVTGGVAADTTVDEAAILADVEGEQAEVGVDEDVQPVGDEQTTPAEQAEPAEQESRQQSVASERAQALSDGMDGMVEAVNPESPNPTGFVGNAIKYLSSLHDKGTSALDKVMGVKAGDFAKWVTRNGKEDFDSEGARTRLEAGLRQFATTGVAPVKGMENEFKALGKLLETVYRSMAAKSGLETTSGKAQDFNTLFVDDVLRSSERELKKGEQPAIRPQFIRIPTKTGGQQKGFKERQHAETFRKNQRDPEGQRLQVEEKDGLFYVIRPVITPGLNHKIDLVNQEAQGRFVDVAPGKVVARPSPQEDVTAVVNAKGRILGVDVGKAYGKLPWVRNNDNRVDSDIELAKNIWVENMFRAKNQALAIRGVLDRMPFSISPGDSATPGRMEGVIARNATDSTVWNDVFESVSRGEDKYDMSPAAREWILDYRETVMDLVSMMQEEGAELKFITLKEDGEIDWGRSGIPGYIPRKYDKEATDAASARVSGRSPKTKRGFDYSRKFPTAGEGVEAGARYHDPMDTLVQFAYEAYAKVADARFGNDPAVIRDALEAQKAPTVKDEGTRLTVGGKQLKVKNRATADSLRNTMEYRTEEAWVKWLKDKNNALKVPLAGGDLSTPVLFGGVMFFDSPKAWFKAFGNSMEALFQNPQVIFDRYASRSDRRGSVAQLAEMGGMLGGDIGVVRGLRGDFWSKATLGLTTKMADSMMAFLNMGVLHSWEAHTAGFTKDETGRVVGGATPEQLAGIASFGNSLVGRFDPVRAGIPRGVTTFGQVTLFSNSMTMGFLSLIGKAAFKGGTEGKLSRRALAKFMTGSVMTYVGLAIAAGLDWEEIKKRINPFEAGSKFLSLPITYANGRTAEYSVGGTVRAVLKALSASYVGIRNRLSGDSTKTSDDPAQTVWEPLFKFFGYRKSPGISLVRGLMGENFLGQPVGWAEAIVDGVTPIFAQEHTAGWVSDMMGAISENNMYRYLAAQLPILDNIAANRPFVDDTATESQKFGEAMVSFFGANVYTAPQQRNMEIQRDRLARERHGVNYDELDPKLRGPITKEVDDMPLYKNRLQKVKDENLWSVAMRPAENYHLNAQKRILGWMRDRGEAGLPLGGANGKNQQLLQSLMVDLPTAPSKYSYKEKGIYKDKVREIVLSRDEKKEYEKRLGMDVNELLNILTNPQDPNGSKWLNATVEFQQGKLKKLISDLSKKNLREIVREGKKQPTKDGEEKGQ